MLSIARSTVPRPEQAADSTPEPDPQPDRRTAKAARREAKSLARARRVEVREQAAAAKALELVYQDEIGPEADEEPADEGPDVRAAARAAAARHRIEAKRLKAESKRSRREAKAAARAETKAGKAGAGSEPDDHIVEPPRAPKLSFPERRRQARAERAAVGGGGPRRLVSLLAGALGAAGLMCSVVLAIGALLVALGADKSSAYDIVSGICDVLVGPLRDAFSFSGANADMKEALVAWGAGSIGYLLVGIVAQSLLRSSVDK